jgi:hypothetical protein
MAIPTRELTTVAPERTDLAPVSDGVALFERLARDPSVDVEKLERLIGMQERILAHQARAAFNAAFSVMQGELPAITEKGRTDKGKYARLEDIVARVRPILERHGFALSHRTEWPGNGTVKVVGILTHREGHERTSEFISAADTSGSKNAVQALGSTVAYGRRYTTKDLLLIVTRGEDDDADSADAAKAPAVPEGFDDWAADMEATAGTSVEDFRTAWKKSSIDYRNYTTRHRPDLLAAWKRAGERHAS